VLTSAFDASGDFSFTVLQYSGVHFAKVDQTTGFYLHDEQFSFILELWDFEYLLVVKLPKYKLLECRNLLTSLVYVALTDWMPHVT
jgi:hypothetical protein